MSQTCSVCCEKKIGANTITCYVETCKFLCCKTCVKKYLLETKDNNPKCMNCKTYWTYDFFYTKLDTDFCEKTYREYKAKLCMEREKSLLPATQAKAEIAKKIKEKKAEIAEMKEYLQILTKELRNLTEESLGVKQEKKTPKYIGHCVENDCKGYLDENYKCGICNKQACKSCRKKLHKGTPCNKEDVETMKMLAKETKPCPGCNIPVFKISGCDQMWCVQCHTVWSWEKGEKLNERIHNPHYYEFLRKTGNGQIRREPGDNPCGVLDWVYYDNVLTELKITPDNIGQFRAMHRELLHNRNAVREFEMKVVENPNTNEDLRIKYLTNSLTEKEWINELKKREKKNEKNKEVLQVAKMYVEASDDIYKSIIAMNNVKDVLGIFKQFRSLIEYVENSYAILHSRYKNSMPKFDMINSIMINMYNVRV